MSQELKIVEYSGKRILTTAQVAEFLETETDIITRNFNRNKDHYTEGKHYFVLKGDDLKKFKLANGQFDRNLKFAPNLYLWTEKGVLMHVKSVNTDIAWQAHEDLVDTYFRVQESTQGKLHYINDRWERLLTVDQVPDHFSIQYAMNQNLFAMDIHKLEWDDDARPDGSQSGLFSRWMNGEKFPGCDVEPPPMDHPDRTKVTQVKQLVHVTKSGREIHRDVYHYPDEFRGYYERWYKRWWFPVHGEKYLSGDVRPGVPRVKNQEKIPEVMQKLTRVRRIS